MRILLFFFICIYSCSSNKAQDEKSIANNPTHDTLQSGFAEQVERKDSFLSKTISTFPETSYSRIVLHQLDGEGNHARAKSVFKQQTGNFKELSKEQIAPFLVIINNEDSYGESTAACHEPRIGLIFYDEKDKICSYLSLCMTCNNVYFKPLLKLHEKKLL